MIDTKSLRIGNRYNHVKAGEIAIEPEWIGYFCKYPELLDGIPLSPSLLERAGAIFPYGDKRCQIGSLCFYWNNARINDYALYLQDSGFNESVSDVPIKFLHHLQNVVLDLTGQELELKP